MPTRHSRTDEGLLSPLPYSHHRASRLATHPAHQAPALATLVILVDRRSCSRCWNECAPSFCDAVLHNTAIGTLNVKQPHNPRMGLLPLADLHQRSPVLCRFTLQPPWPEAFGEFVRELSKPKLEDNYNLALVQLTHYGPLLVEEKPN